MTEPKRCHQTTVAPWHWKKNPRNFNGTFRSIPKHPKRYHLTLDMVDSEAEFLHRSSVQRALAFGTDLSVFNTCSGYGKCPTGCAHFVHRGNCRHPSVFYFKFQKKTCFWASFVSSVSSVSRFLESQSMWTTIAVSEQPRNWSLLIQHID